MLLTIARTTRQHYYSRYFGVISIPNISFTAWQGTRLYISLSDMWHEKLEVTERAMNISSGTVVLASAVLTLTAAAFGQQQQTASSQTGMNFYVTTPQTGETVPVGAPPATSQQQKVVVASAQAARSLNTYTDRAVSSRLNAAPVQSASQTSTRAPQAQPATPVSQVQATSARHPQSQAAPVAAPGRQTQLASAPNPASAHGYSIQQVSNAPASSFQAARSSAASSRAIHAQNART